MTLQKKEIMKLEPQYSVSFVAQLTNSNSFSHPLIKILQILETSGLFLLQPFMVNFDGILGTSELHPFCTHLENSLSRKF